MATDTSDSVNVIQEAGIAWWVILLQGIAAVILGLLLLTNTGTTLATLVVLLGVYWFVLGIFDLFRIFTDPAGWGWKLLSGVVGIVAGLVLIRNPLWTAAITTSVLVWLIGVLGVVLGGLALLRAVTGAGWGIALSGLLSIALGLLLLFHTATTLVVLIYAAGIIAVVGGGLEIIGAIVFRAQLGAGARRVAF
ncbi:MAG TPA: DUF308 domain-containing protein [Candidatus Dormibacteraeota bacterium]|nr:DUF308 domain-containing protein [Candidatus Dormibacteraeota bacterium]